MIAAEGEHKASRALRHAAEVICDSPAALQVLFSGKTDRIRHRNRQKDTAKIICDSPAALQVPTNTNMYQKKKRKKVPKENEKHQKISKP